MPIVSMPDGTLVDLPDKLTPEQTAALARINGQTEQPKEESFLSEAGRVIDKSVRGGLMAIPNAIRQGGNWLEKKFPTPEWTKINIPEKVVKTYDELTTPNEPKTPTGKTLGNIGESVVGALVGPGGLTKTAAAIGLGSGVGSEVAGKATGDNAIAKVAGALIGGGGVGALSKLKPNSNKIIRDATSEVPASDWKKAAELEATLTANQIPHLKSQLLGDRSTLKDVVAQAASHSKVRPKLVAATENIPEQSRKAIDDFVSRNISNNTDETRAILSDIQETASNRIGGLKKEANQAFTDAVSPGTAERTMEPSRLAAGISALRQKAKDPNYFGEGTEGGRFLTGLADRLESLGQNKVSVGQVNNISKDLKNIADKEGYAGVALKQSKDIMKSMTPEYDAARSAKASFMNERVKPAEQGLAGQLAQMGGGIRPDKYTAKSTAIDMVFPKDRRQPEAIRQLANDIGGDGLGELLSEHISKSMEKAVKLTSGSNVQQPFDFVKSIAGTNAQRQNLESALTETAKAMGSNPNAVKKGFYKLLDALESTKNLDIPNGVDIGSIKQQVGQNVLSGVISPQNKAFRSLWERATEKNYKKIADIVTSPDGLKQIEKIAKSKDPSVVKPLVRSILANAFSSDSDNKE